VFSWGKETVHVSYCHGNSVGPSHLPKRLNLVSPTRIYFVPRSSPFIVDDIQEKVEELLSRAYWTRHGRDGGRVKTTRMFKVG